MVEVITDFKDFVTTIKEQNKHTVNFKVADKEYGLTYSELSSQEDIKSMKEFERWFKDAYPALEKKEYAVNQALDMQWRIWRMVKPHTRNMEIFDDFLALPPPVVSAMVLAVNTDIRGRYPHLVKKEDV